MLLSLESKRPLESARSLFLSLSFCYYSFSDERETIWLSGGRLFTVGEQNSGEESWCAVGRQTFINKQLLWRASKEELEGAAFVSEGPQKAKLNLWPRL